MSDDEYYEVPLRDQRYFGAGIKRKRIQFVSSTAGTNASNTSLPPASKESAADKYLDIVLGRTRAAAYPATPKATSSDEETQTGEELRAGRAYTDGEDAAVLMATATKEVICEICGRPVAVHANGSSHESMLAHQLSLPHSHPPSNVDRTRKGLNVLQTQGWDPDSRRGLGAQGEGRREPVKAVEKADRAGLGAKLAPVKLVEKPVKLDAGKLRLAENEGKKKAASLRNDFYANDDVLKYLGEQGDVGGVELGYGATRRKGRRKR